jgi:Domain of unknown function (DUF4388)
MALEGTLRDFSLSDIFQLIGLQRKTGVLTLRSSEDVVTVSFLDGKVVGADSLNKRLEDRLGQVLLKTGAVTKAELDAALKTQMETLERLGHILLERTVISREELRKAFEQQLLQIIYRVFRWQDGDYHFSQETSVDYDAELVAPLGSESILMEGARMLDEWPIIEKKIPHRGMIFMATPAARQAEVTLEQEEENLETFDMDLEPVAPKASSSGRVRISPTERDVLALVNGSNAVDDIVRRSPHGEFDTCKALYTLLTRSLIRQATRDEVARAAQKTVTEVIPPPAWHAQFPWLAIVLLPLLALTIFLAPRNPANPLLGPAPKLLPRAMEASSWSHMAGIWHTLQARALLTGTFPDTLGELTRERLLRAGDLQDPWGRMYRYVLREQSVVLAGNNSNGAPDSNLMFFQHLGAENEETPTGPGAVLVTP